MINDLNKAFNVFVANKLLPIKKELIKLIDKYPILIEIANGAYFDNNNGDCSELSKICNSLCGNGLSKEILEFLDGGEFDLICESGIYESDKRYY